MADQLDYLSSSGLSFGSHTQNSANCLWVRMLFFSLASHESQPGSLPMQGYNPDRRWIFLFKTLKCLEFENLYTMPLKICNDLFFFEIGIMYQRLALDSLYIQG